MSKFLQLSTFKPLFILWWWWWW